MENPVKYLLGIRHSGEEHEQFAHHRDMKTCMWKYSRGSSLGCARGGPQITHCALVRIWNWRSTYASCHHFWFPNHPEPGRTQLQGWPVLTAANSEPGPSQVTGDVRGHVCFSSQCCGWGQGVLFLSLEKHEELDWEHCSVVESFACLARPWVLFPSIVIRK